MGIARNFFKNFLISQNEISLLAQVFSRIFPLKFTYLQFLYLHKYPTGNLMLLVQVATWNDHNKWQDLPLKILSNNNDESQHSNLKTLENFL